MTIGHDWELRRRDLLKALGVGVGCLPVLHGHRAFGAGVGAAPKKLVIVASTEGYRQMNWRPKDGPLATQTLPDSSSPLEPHKADLIFMPDMTNPAFAGPRHGGFPNHLAAGPNSGVNEYRVPYSATVDQVIGDALSMTNGLSRSTLNLGVLSSQGIMGEGNNSKWCIYRGKDQPVLPEQDPWKTYGDIFGGATASAGATTTPTAAAAAASTQAAVGQLMARKQSILDFVGTDLERFAGRVGTDYQTLIGGHLQAVRDLEKELQALSTTTTGGSQAQCAVTPGTAVTATDPMNYAALIQAQMKLLVMALKCGVTQVATLQMVDAGGTHIPFNFLPGISGMGINGSNLRTWHDLSHNPVTAGVDMKSIVDKWCITQFASLLDQMTAIPEPGGTMLDNSVVLITNHMQDGANHDTQKLPWMLAGSCQGYFKTGQSALSAGNPINGVLADVCNAMGVPVTYFGDPGFGKPWVGLRA
jgi:hypothetical protein